MFDGENRLNEWTREEMRAGEGMEREWPLKKGRDTQKGMDGGGN